MGEQSVNDFATRLCEAMRNKGLTSDRSRSGVDVVALAKGAGLSYEMARRYVEGKATPRPDALGAIADWLGVKPSSLLFPDDNVIGQGIDHQALARCIKAVREASVLAGIELTDDQGAQIVAQLYDELLRGNSPSVSTIAALLRAMDTNKK